MAITPQEKDNIIALTVATFNAAPGATFLQEFATAIDRGMSFETLADILVATPQFKQDVLHGAVTNEGIAAVLLNNFGLSAGNTDPTSADAQAEEFFIARLEQGADIGDIIIEAGVFLLGGTVPPEFQATADLFQNKNLVAGVYSETNSDDNVGDLQFVLAGVTADGPTTRAEAEQFLADKGLGPNVGETFTLTTAVDNIVGTADNDTINGVVDGGASATLNNGDVVDGGGGVDTANFTITGVGGWPAGATISNVEKFFFRNVSGADDNLNLANVTGATELWNSDPTNDTDLVLLNIQNNATLGIANTTGNLGALFKDGTIGAGGTVNLAVNNAGTSTDAALVAAGHAGAANTATDVTLAVDARGANVVTFDDVGGANSIGGLQTITVSGDGSLDLAANTNEFDNVTTVDASANSGGLTLHLGANAEDVTFTGGSGDDDLTLPNFTADDTVDGGDGDDTLNVTAADIGGFTKAAAVTNVETLGLVGALGGNTIVNSSLFGISNITLTDGFDLDTFALTLNNLANNTNITFAGDAVSSGTVAVNVTGAIANAADAATLTLGEGANNTVVDVNAAGLETINLVTADVAGAGAQLGTLTDTQLTTLNVTGSDGISIDLSGSENITTVDASGVVADADGNVNGVSLDLSVNSKAVTFTGGEGDDTYTASNEGGTVTGGLGSDTITLGSGADKLIYNAAAESDGTDSTDTINNFDETADFIQFAASLQVGTASYINSDPFTNTGSTQLRMNGSDLEVDLNGDATADMVITLTGITSADFSAANFVFA